MKKLISFLFTAAVLTINTIQAYEEVDYYPQQDCGCAWGTFSVGAEYLYWKTEESKLQYGAAVSGTMIGADLIIESRVLKPKFQYDSGYRIFADYTTCDCLWQFSAAYTHMPTHASNHFATSMVSMNFASIFNVNFPILSIISSTALEETNSKWSADTNYVDLDCARTFVICHGLEITPHIGARILWMDQTFRLNGSSVEELTFNTKLTGELCAGGLQGGLNAAWRFFDNFSIIGNVGGAVLYANFHNHGRLEGLSISEVESSIDIKYKDNNRKGIPMFDAFIGLQYENCFDQFAINIHAGWEEHIIFSTNEFSISDSGNTTLQGLTVGGSVSF